MCAAAGCHTQVEANIGERRITAWSGVGISICPELDVAAITEQSGAQYGGVFCVCLVGCVLLGVCCGVCVVGVC
jgi:hypothetical protein